MKRKNFLMGLGIGLVCSGAVLMLFQGAARGETQLTEAQIRERAAKLGMVDGSENAILNSDLQQVKSDAEHNDDGTSVSDDDSQEKDSQKVKDSDTKSGQETDRTDSSQETEKMDSTDNPDEADKTEKTDNPDEVDKTEKTDTAQSVTKKDKKNKQKKEKNKGSKKKNKTGSTVTITIEPGMMADQICAKLQENAIIEDEKKFLNYIIDKSLQSKLLAGTFELQKNMDYDDILQEITK